MNHSHVLLLGLMVVVPNFALADEPAPDAPPLETVVTATRDPSDPKHLPQSVSVVTPDELQRRQPRTPNQALREEPGVFSVEVNAQGSPIIRGALGNRILYLWDGVRINNGALFGGPNGFFNQFPLGTIDRIEVLRGPGAVEYGSDAIGGVVQILSKKPNPFTDVLTYGGSVNTQFGSVDRQATAWNDLWLTGSWFSARAGITGQDVNGYVGPGVGVIKNTGFEALGGNADLALKLSTNQTLTLSWIQNGRFNVESYAQSRLNPSGIPRILNPKEERSLTKLTYEAKSVTDWLDTVTGYAYFQGYDQIRETRVQGTGATASTLNNTIATGSQNTSGAGLQGAFPLHLLEARLVAGADWRYENLSSAKKLHAENLDNGADAVSIPLGNTPDGSYDVFDAFAHLQLRPVRWLDISGGGRFESAHLHSRPSATDVVAPLTLDELTVSRRWNSGTWSAGVVGWFTHDIGLAANVATGFRAPTFSDALSYSVPVFASGVVSLPSPGVKPEHSITYEAGPRWVSSDVNASVTVYDTELTDIIIQKDGPTVDVPGVGSRVGRVGVNAGTGFIRGVEAAASVKVHPRVTVFGNATYTRGEDTTNHVPLRFMPPLNGILGARYEAEQKKYWVEGVLQLVDKLKVHAPDDEKDAGFSTDPAFGSPSASNAPLPKFEIPGYAVLYLRGGVTAWKDDHGSALRITLDLNNVFNDSYREAYAQQQLVAPGFGAVLGTQIVY